jgi:hypothetical protein
MQICWNKITVANQNKTKQILSFKTSKKLNKMENQRPKKTYRMVKPLAVKTKLTVIEKAAENMATCYVCQCYHLCATPQCQAMQKTFTQ